MSCLVWVVVGEKVRNTILIHGVTHDMDQRVDAKRIQH